MLLKQVYEQNFGGCGSKNSLEMLVANLGKCCCCFVLIELKLDRLSIYLAAKYNLIQFWFILTYLSSIEFPVLVTRLGLVT